MDILIQSKHCRHCIHSRDRGEVGYCDFNGGVLDWEEDTDLTCPFFVRATGKASIHLLQIKLMQRERKERELEVPAVVNG